MSAMSRTKGQAGEREIAALIRDLTGWEVRRRVRQHDGDSDLEGVPGWSVEVKRHRTAARGDLVAWWKQTARQAECAGAVPVLFFRADRHAWRAVWPLSLCLADRRAAMWSDYAWTAEGSVEAWAAVARATVYEMSNQSGAVSDPVPQASTAEVAEPSRERPRKPSTREAQAPRAKGAHHG